MAQESPLVAPIVGEHYADLRGLSGLIAPPYDVISDAERRELAARSPHNIVHLILPEGSGDRYAAAARTLEQWRATGVIIRDTEPACYVLAQEFTTPDGRIHARTGLLAGVAVESYAGGRVRPHEKTHAGPKADRLALMTATRTMFESLFFLAPDKAGGLSRALADETHREPWARAALDGVQIRLWRVSGAGAATLAAAAGDALYIADGHHRFETAGAYRGTNPRADRTAGLIVPLGDPGLVVLATHRLIIGAPVPQDRVMAALKRAFTVEAIEPELDVLALLGAPQRGTSCVIALPGGVTLLATLQPDADTTPAGLGIVGELDVARIDALVVNPVRDLAGPDATVSYSASPGDVLARVGSGRVAAAVLLPPTRVGDVLAVADAGGFMPQKSTYFVPKVPSGLVLLPVG